MGLTAGRSRSTKQPRSPSSPELARGSSSVPLPETKHEIAVRNWSHHHPLTCSCQISENETNTVWEALDVTDLLSHGQPWGSSEADQWLLYDLVSVKTYTGCGYSWVEFQHGKAVGITECERLRMYLNGITVQANSDLIAWNAVRCKVTLHRNNKQVCRKKSFKYTSWEVHTNSIIQRLDLGILDNQNVSVHYNNYNNVWNTEINSFDGFDFGGCTAQTNYNSNQLRSQKTCKQSHPRQDKLILPRVLWLSTLLIAN